MRQPSYVLVTLGALIALGPWACSGDDSNNGSGGAASSTTTTTTTTTSASSTTSSGSIDCHGAFAFNEPCGSCLEGSCCSQISACAADPDCYACIMGTGSGCETNDNVNAL